MKLPATSQIECACAIPAAHEHVGPFADSPFVRITELRSSDAKSSGRTTSPAPSAAAEPTRSVAREKFEP
jgi:hypothetical protein